MSDVGNALQGRPAENPATRFTGVPVPNTLTGPRLPPNALQVPPPMMQQGPPPPAAVPVPPQGAGDAVGPPQEAGPPNVGAIRAAHPHVGMGNMPDEQAVEAFKQHGHDNVMALWKAVRQKPWFNAAAVRARAKPREAQILADQHDISPRQAAAVMANLPGDGRAESMLRTVRDEKDTPFDEGMRAFVRNRMENRNNPKLRENGLRMLDEVPKDAKLKDLDEPMHKAFFIRASDELKGKERWRSFHALAQAAKALKSDDLDNIKESLGLHPEVRTRYNTIVDPGGGHVVIDRHAIEAAHMMPHAAKRGDDALHQLYGDIYRRAASTVSQSERRKYTPNEVHGVVSEAVKGLFDKPEHYAQGADGEPTHQVGQVAKYFHTLARHHAALGVGPGVMSREMARVATARAAGGISDPPWWRQ